MGALHVLRLIVVVALVIAVPTALLAGLLGFVRDGVERAALALGGALCVVIVTGLALELVHGGYGFAAWAVALLVAAAALGAAWHRVRGTTAGRPRLRSPRLAAPALVVALAAAAAIGAVVVARSGAEARLARTPWVELWARPVTATGARYVIVGASAHDSAASYVVRVSTGAATTRTFRGVALPDGAVWRARVRVASTAAPVTATLVGPDGLLRRVRVAPAAWVAARSGP